MTNEALQPENTPNSTPARKETDSQKVVRQHLEDKNHTISEEDIRNVRIGVTPVSDPETEKKLDEIVEEIEKEKKDDQDDIAPKDNPITPWDTLQH